MTQPCEGVGSRSSWALQGWWECEMSRFLFSFLSQTEKSELRSFVEKGPMPEIFTAITAWFTTPGIRIPGILIIPVILSQMSGRVIGAFYG